MIGIPPNVLSRHLHPLCPRDNHVMKYERPSRLHVENQACYHCGFMGCSVRFNSFHGYYTLIGMPDHPNPVDEPGVNTAMCPTHHGWLYRRVSKDEIPGVLWSCGVEGCAYTCQANTKGNWTRT